jgi:hypothetical protein
MELIEPSKLVDALAVWQRTEGSRIDSLIPTLDNASIAALLTPLPDLVTLMVNLVLDTAIDVEVRHELHAGVHYVLKPDDLVDDSEPDLRGFADDAAVIASPLKKMFDSDPESVVRHWHNNGNVSTMIEHLYERREELLNYGLRRI